jgi:hypothetical protein
MRAGQGIQWRRQQGGAPKPRSPYAREVPLKPEDHTQWVGAIVTNLQALETVLRYFLLRLRKQDPLFPKVGDNDAKKTYLTRSLSLGKIINKYNRVLHADEGKFKVDFGIVHIRDAFAHGRLLTPTELPARLWKFGRAKKGSVKIDFGEELTLEWLKNAALMIDREKDKVVACFRAHGYEGLG